MYTSIKEIVTAAEITGESFSELMIKQEVSMTGRSREAIWQQMEKNLLVMKQSVERSTVDQGVFSPTGLTGGDAVKMLHYRQKGKSLAGDSVLKGVQYALGVNEVNAAMGLICATPTAGASGTLPGVVFSIAETLNLDHEQQVRFLFTAALFGMIVANNAMISGAMGGCQAEVGSASAISAAAAVEAAGGTPQQSATAFAIAMGNLLGLICDPVAGLVEVPCVKRNAIGATNALIAADMALAGIENIIPADETIDAMRRVGLRMPREHRETGLGGLATTQTGIDIYMKIFGKDLSLRMGEDEKPLH